MKDNQQENIVAGIQKFNSICKPYSATLLAVSKLKPIEDVLTAYNVGQRQFAENYVQELVDKYETAPKDNNWHFIGHLQSNKVKYIIPFVHLIHGVDSLKLLQEISKQTAKINRVVDVLLQVYIAKEDTKFGLDPSEIEQILSDQVKNPLSNIRIKGLMGMASNTEDKQVIKSEFELIASLKTEWAQRYLCPSIELTELSIGMTNDIDIALAAGSTMVRIGTAIFGNRTKTV